MTANSVAVPVQDEGISDENAANSDVAEAIGGVPLFQNLPDIVLATIAENSDARPYEAGQTIFSMGQYDGAEFFIVTSGRIRITVVDAQSGAMYIDEVGEGGLFGLEIALNHDVGDMVQRLSVTAEESSVVTGVDAETFRELATQRPTLMRNIAMHFASELSSVRYKAMAVEAAPEQRIYATLLEFVERDSVSGEWRIENMPKHREIADLAGVDEAETASAVATLIQEGVASRDYPGMVINDMTRLGQLAK